MDIQNFINTYNNKSMISKTDGGYPGQCVSLINRYCWEVLNVPAGAWGNAKDWATNSIQRNYFNLVSGSPILGDIIIFGSDYGGGYGHIAISLGDGRIFDQNGNAGTGKTGIFPEYKNRIAILRPKNGLPSVLRRKRVIADILNVRTAPNLSAPLAIDARAGIPDGKLRKGNIVIVKNTVVGENYGAGNQWHETRSGYFIASAYTQEILQ